MSTLLKNIYSISFYDNLSIALEQVLPGFNRDKFITAIFDNDWDSKELKARMKHTANVLHQFMPKDFKEAAGVIKKMILQLKENGSKDGNLAFMFLPEYLETYGINDFNTAVNAIEFVTQFTSCEFAVRPFIIKYGDKMLNQMTAWSKHENLHVRRLASEGSRPRLPWAIAIPALKKDPTPILPLLENLKADPSEYVRRSVANSLNDIAKDNPEIVIAIAKKWKGLSKETDAIIKHGSRTLLKKGNAEILSYYGLSNDAKLEISNFKVLTPKVKTGDDLEFSFAVHNGSLDLQTIRLEYAVYFLRQNGQLSKKVFKISERVLKAGEKADVIKKQSFRIITTRKYYSGLHKLSIIINGQEKAIDEFDFIF